MSPESATAVIAGARIASGGSRMTPKVVPAIRGLRISLGTKLTLFATLVFGVASVLLAFDLTTRERKHRLEAERSSAEGLADLLAFSLSADVEAGRREGATSVLERISANPDVLLAVVWRSGEERPFARYVSPGADSQRVASLSSRLAVGSATVSLNRLELTDAINDQTGQRIGTLAMDFSLAVLNQHYREAKVRILSVFFAAMIATILLFLGLARWQIVNPIRRLAMAAKQLEQGKRTVVRVGSSDEIGDLARVFNKMGEALVQRHELLQKEVDLAMKIQTSLLPRRLEVPGLAIGARMKPATEVGGDYYDVLPVPGGCWFGIGDVAGHGLNAGLVMLMIQSSLSTLVHRDPRASPRELLIILNRVIFENVRTRLQSDDHATLSILRYDSDGEFRFAGAHECFIHYRAAEGRCVTIETSGTWVGALENLEPFTHDTSLRMEKGDVLVLYTDGVTESRRADGMMFGTEGICKELERVHDRGPEAICAHIFNAATQWAPVQKDDLTVLVIERLSEGPSTGEALGTGSIASGPTV